MLYIELQETIFDYRTSRDYKRLYLELPETIFIELQETIRDYI